MPAAGEGPGPMMRHQGNSTGWTPASAQGWCPVFTARTVLPVMVIERAPLMTRMGHDSPRAALIYQHASAEADLAIAAAINEMVEAATSADAKPAASTKTRPDDDDEDGAGALARLG